MRFPPLIDCAFSFIVADIIYLKLIEIVPVTLLQLHGHGWLEPRIPAVFVVYYITGILRNDTIIFMIF